MRHLSSFDIPTNVIREIREVAKAEKSGTLTNLSCLGGAELPISNTFNESGEMDFVDNWGRATFLHIQGNFSRFTLMRPLARKRRTYGGNGSINGEFAMREYIRYARNYDCR